MKLPLFNLLPQISRHKALRIAAQACTPTPENLVCYDGKPDGVSIYGYPLEDAPCWWIPICYGDHVGGGRIMAISKRTGEILYDGSDGME